MKFPPARTACFLSLALVFLLASCGNDPNPKPLENKRPDGSPWVVRYIGSPGSDVRSLDPQNMYDMVSRQMLEPVYDCLLEYDPMKTDPYEIVPCLLEEVPTHTNNPDGTVDYLCKLKPGIFYHDDPCFPGGKGREVVAGDVQYSFQRICDPKVECPVSDGLAEYVAGLKETMDAVTKNGNVMDYDKMKVSGIEVIDPHTFKLHLLKPYPQIKYWLAMHFTCPVAREAVEYYDGQQHPGETGARPVFKRHPVGDGPFQIKEHIEGQSYRFVRNPNYHTTVFPSGGWPADREAVNRPLAGHALPLVDEVDVTLFREMLPIWLLTRQGYLDRMGVMQSTFSSVVGANRELAPNLAARGMSLVKLQEVATFYMNFNMTDPVFGKNKKLRQALSCAYNPQGAIDLLYGGVAPVAQQLLSPGIYGFQKDFKNPYGFNLEKAKQLMVEAGYPNGIDPKTGKQLELTMDCVAEGSDERVLAEYEQRQLEQVGVKVNIRENDFARSLERQDQGNFQLDNGSGWGADYPDPENYFFLFTTENKPPNGKNIGRYSNPEFDALFKKMATMDDGPERLEIIHRMNDILIEDCPIILTFNKAYYVLSQPWAPMTHTNMMLEGGLKYLPLDTTMREEKRREWNRKPVWPIPVAAVLVVLALVYGIRMNRRRNV